MNAYSLRMTDMYVVRPEGLLRVRFPLELWMEIGLEEMEPDCWVRLLNYLQDEIDFFLGSR